MSREEILEKLGYNDIELTESSACVKKLYGIVISAMDEYAKQVAIEFAIYLKEKEMLPQYDKEPIWQKRDGWKRYTTEQIYSLFHGGK